MEIRKLDIWSFDIIMQLLEIYKDMIITSSEFEFLSLKDMYS